MEHTVAYALFGIIKILVIFGSFFYHNFQLKDNFQIMMVSSEMPVSGPSDENPILN